jgi:hypothetical protein
MAQRLSIVPSHAAPMTSRLVSEAAQALVTHSNLQTANVPFPVLFYDQVTVQSGADQAFRSDAFVNNTGKPIELRSMRVVISGGPTVAGGGAAIANGGIAGLGLSVGKISITEGAVPVWLLARSDDRYEEFSSPSVANYVWHFSQPFPLMPGQGIAATGKHFGGIPGGTALTIGLSFVGRVSPKPVPNRIPFAAAWTSRAFAYAEVGTDQSPPSALMNDAKRDVTIDRIIGRAIAYDDISLGAGNVEMRDYGDVSVQGAYSFLVRLGLSQNRPILKTYTPWRVVFGKNAAIETKFIMKPGDFLPVDVRHVAGPTLAVPFTFSQNRGAVSIVGWREV